MSARSAIVIGGGVSGLAAARRLAAGGASVTLLEAAPTLGGLVEGVTVAGTPLERFYHYLIPGEPDILELIEELGLTELVEWFPSSIGILAGRRVWPFTTPLDLIRFAPLRPPDRVRSGLAALRLGRIADWQALDRISAREWLTQLTNSRVTAVVWDPLLRAKFGPAADTVPAAWMWGRLQQRRGARRGSGERLGYMRGGFRLLFRALEADLGAAGVVVRTGARVERILVEGGRATGVVVGEEGLEADAVLFAGTLPRLVGLVPHELVAPQWRDAVGLGCVCVIVDLPRALTPVFWTNVCDDDIPFGGIIEHTNLVPTSWYGGRHVVYLSRYFAPEEDIATADLETVTKEWLEACERLFPHFSAADVGDLKVFRTPYGAPLVSYPYLPRIAPVASHIPGVYVATTAQIYPQDRGMSEGIKRGVQAAELILATGWMCPVCHGRDRADLYGVPAEGSEGGVDAVSFRPSSDRYGQTAGRLVRCTTCGHASLLDPPAPQAVSEAYAEAADEVSLREEPGQVETARRALGRVERQVAPGRLLDVGCWTGSFLEAGRQRGWQARGVEPSTWAAARAAARGLDVEATTLDEADLAPESFDLVVACDVLEHLLDPAAALSRIGAVLRPGGILYLTVPDAGSRLARVMGRRWWSVLPMHVQYYTRASMTRLLDRAGFSVTEMATHPKVFSAGYYAERLASFVPGTAGIVTLAGRLRIAGRLVAPDFRDRLQAIATRR